MKTIGFIVCAFAMISSAASVAAQDIDTSNNNLIVSGGMTVQEVAAIFEQESMRATIKNDTELTGNAWDYEFDVLGYHCNAASRCTEFLFLTGFDLPNGFPIEKVNEWNFSMPAGRAFLDAEGDPYLDHSVSVSGPHDKGAFREGLLLWLNALEDYEEFLNDQTASA